MAVITGTAANDILVGTTEDDTIDGLAGSDTMSGGLGNDIYYVNSTGDLVVEYAGQGIDTVYSSISYTLGVELENLTLLDAGGYINATGNALNNVLIGNIYNNTLNGGAGADTMSGGSGDDFYYVDNAGDVVIENAGEGIDTVFAYWNTYTVLGANIENLTSSYNMATLIGNDGDNVLTATYHGSYGYTNLLDGGLGADTMSGGMYDDVYIVDNAGDVVIESTGLNSGTDTVYSSANTYTLTDNVENLILTGTAISGTGNSLGNAITGNSQINTLAGGAGNDAYYVQNTADVVIENAGEGTDTVNSSVSYTLDGNIENLTLTGTANINGTGNSLSNVLTGNSGINTLAGGAGNDIYYVGAGDVIIEEAGEGIDTVYANSYTLPVNVENLISGYNKATLIGNDGNNVLTATYRGSYGYTNVLDGGLGADTMAGGMYDDVYYVDNAGDVVIEYASEGYDIIYSSIDYSLATEVESLELTGTAVSGTGNSGNNTLTGNANDNVLDGAAGNDVLNGAAGIDTLMGGGGNDTLNGGAGTDTLIGGTGNDTFVVDNLGDVVVENPGEGTDTVQSWVNGYTLADNVENLTLLGTVLSGTGNDLNNALTGNASNNVMDGGDGVDNLYGGNGNDTLDGGLGADTLHGGAGNDIFYVNDAGDVVLEVSATYVCTGCSGCGTVGGGIDTIWSLVSYALSDDPDKVVENLFLLGGDDVDDPAFEINATGNSLNNWLKGNGEENTLDGGAGADLMEGGKDEDLYIVDNVGDVVVEYSDIDAITGLEHIDTVQSSVSYSLSAYVENLTLTGSAAINATGNSADNVLTGNGANNILTGGTGLDIFVFNTALGASNVDTIADFAGGSDGIQLAQAIFSGCALGELSATAFLSGAGVTAATTADERIAYDTTTGMLYYDADGVGGTDSIAFASLTTAPLLAASDIAVV